MDDLRHLFPRDTARSETYTSPLRGRDNLRLPPRDDRAGHGKRLVREILAAESQVREHTADRPKERRPKGVVLDFCSDPGFKLKLIFDTSKS
jgi:hypothetical protein